MSAKLGQLENLIPARLTSGRPVTGSIEGYIRDSNSDYGPILALYFLKNERIRHFIFKMHIKIIFMFNYS